MVSLLRPWVAWRLHALDKWPKTMRKRMFLTLGLITVVTVLLSFDWNMSNTDPVPAKLGETTLRTSRRKLATRYGRTVECQALNRGDLKAVDNAKHIMLNSVRVPIPDRQFVDMTQKCSSFTREKNYIRYPRKTPKDEDFPIAFSILIYHYVDQVEHLLRAIYRPQNIYCIHVDRRAPEDVYVGMNAVTKCFDNVFLSSRRTTVIYGGYSVLEAHLNCMKDALTHQVKWKYLINLSGEMFPLKTNKEIVGVLRAINGSNDLCGMNASSYKYRWKFKYLETNYLARPIRTNLRNPPPPHNITLVKGNVYGLYSREFLQYAVSDPIATDLLYWMKHVSNAEEFFFATLHHTKHNPHLKVPGSFKGDFSRRCRGPWIHWHSAKRPCDGLILRGICIPGVKMLSQLITSSKMFVNKLLPYTHDYIVMDCLEEWLRNKTVLER